MVAQVDVDEIPQVLLRQFEDPPHFRFCWGAGLEGKAVRGVPGGVLVVQRGPDRLRERVHRGVVPVHCRLTYWQIFLKNTSKTAGVRGIKSTI
jgi:hypothetical protein